MPLSLVVGVWLVGALCIVCLMASMAVLIKARELHSRSVDILVCAYNWVEGIRHEQEVNAHEGTN